MKDEIEYVTISKDKYDELIEIRDKVLLGDNTLYYYRVGVDCGFRKIVSNSKVIKDLIEINNSIQHQAENLDFEMEKLQYELKALKQEKESSNWLQKIFKLW